MKRNFMLLIAFILGITTFTPIFASKPVNAQVSGTTIINETSILAKSDIGKYDDYVKIENYRYIYIENNVLNSLEKKELQKALFKMNELLKTTNISKSIVSKENKTFEFKSGLQTRGFGKRAFYVHWWGFEIWLTKDDTVVVCGAGAAGVGQLIAKIPHIGTVIAGNIVSWLGPVVCHFTINSGTVIHYNYTFGVDYFRWQ